MRRGSLLQLLGIGLVAGAIATCVAIFVPWLPTPASREAGRIWFVYWFATVISLAIFSVVVAVLVYSMINFRVKKDDLSDGPPIHGHTTLEIVWTAIPTVLVTAIAVVSAVVLAKDSHAGANPLVVKVTGIQFAWSFTYPNGQTYPILRLPIDQHVKLEITSNDVIHSFWVPNFAQKQDAVPGQINPLVITPDRLGHYPVICTELCGLGHALMRSEAIVMSAGDYKAWYQGSAAASATVSPTAIFTSKGCVACHTFTPIAAARGKVGPDLDNLKRDAAKAGQPVAQYIEQSIVDPNAYITPGYKAGVMPSFKGQIPAPALNALVQYLAKNAKG
ncbi:MAG: cytochrome c oxidase subunit II [Solirubrobacterales bacterium]|nr:cytochrome c oxidase subunit II [Solirubrobacterales bacterium]